MSFLRKETNQSSALSSASAASKLPSSYSESECKVILEPVVKPVGTASYERGEHKNQMAVVAKLKAEAPGLFQHKNVISKEHEGERLYKQKQQFSSKISMESLAQVLQKQQFSSKISMESL